MVGQYYKDNIGVWLSTFFSIVSAIRRILTHVQRLDMIVCVNIVKSSTRTAVDTTKFENRNIRFNKTYRLPRIQEFAIYTTCTHSDREVVE